MNTCLLHYAASQSFGLKRTAARIISASAIVALAGSILTRDTSRISRSAYLRRTISLLRFGILSQIDQIGSTAMEPCRHTFFAQRGTRSLPTCMFSRNTVFYSAMCFGYACGRGCSVLKRRSVQCNSSGNRQQAQSLNVLPVDQLHCFHRIALVAVPEIYTVRVCTRAERNENSLVTGIISSYTPVVMNL
jgi:hypothetical protein